MTLQQIDDWFWAVREAERWFREEPRVEYIARVYSDTPSVTVYLKNNEQIQLYPGA